MTVFNKSTGAVRVIDARETAPGRATRDMFHGDKNASRIGKKKYLLLYFCIPNEQF